MYQLIEHEQSVYRYRNVSIDNSSETVRYWIVNQTL